MKKLFFLGLIILILIIVTTQNQAIPSPPINPLPSISPTASPSLLNQLATITFKDQLYHYAFTIIDDFNNLYLYPNFKDQASSQDLVQQHSCQVLVNAGFYTPDNQPLGWLVSQNQELSSVISSQLFNGFLSISQTLDVSSTPPSSLPRLGLQSGPLLIQNQQPLLLKIKDDQSRRRLIALQTTNNRLIFLAITGQDSLFTGPLLADTPSLLTAILSQINQPAQTAINLDGGSASTFYTPDFHLEEFSPIGSFFCVK